MGQHPNYLLSPACHPSLVQAQAFVDEVIPEDQETCDLSHPLRIVVAYDEVAAGKRAMRVMTDLGRGLGEVVEFQSLLWSFDLLEDTDWAEVASDDAVKADILIIATSSANSLPPTVGRWAQAAISRKEGTATAVVALFGTEGNAGGPGPDRLEAIRSAATQAGLGFFTAALWQKLDETMERVHQRPEMRNPSPKKCSTTSGPHHSKRRRPDRHERVIDRS